MFCCHGYMALRQLHSFPTRALPIWAAETQKLLTYGFRFFENRKFYAANQVVASPKIWKGAQDQVQVGVTEDLTDRKSTRLNSSHVRISYAVFCLKKKNVKTQ